MTNTEIKQAIKKANNVYVTLAHVEWPVRISKSEAYELVKRFKVEPFIGDKGTWMELEVSYKN